MVSTPRELALPFECLIVTNTAVMELEGWQSEFETYLDDFTGPFASLDGQQNQMWFLVTLTCNYHLCVVATLLVNRRIFS